MVRIFYENSPWSYIFTPKIRCYGNPPPRSLGVMYLPSRILKRDHCLFHSFRSDPRTADRRVPCPGVPVSRTPGPQCQGARCPGRGWWGGSDPPSLHPIPAHPFHTFNSSSISSKKRPRSVVECVESRRQGIRDVSYAINFTN